MKRVLAFALVFLFALAVSAQAQEPPRSSKAPAPVSVGTTAGPSASMFSKASIEQAVRSATKMASVPRSNGKSFFKTPWPYVIAGAIVAIVLIAMNTGSSSGTGIY